MAVSSKSRRSFLLAVLLSGLASGAAGQGFGDVSGRILDAANLAPVSNVAVSIEGTEIDVLTNAEGVFYIAGVASGQRELVLQHIAYGEHRRGIIVEPGENFALEVQISQRAIEIAPLSVQVATELERRRTSTGFTMNEIVVDEIEDASRRGLNFTELLRQGMPGLSVRGDRRGGTCIEYRGGIGVGRADCRSLAVYMDGVPVSQPSLLFGMLPLQDLARVEVLSPGQASARYGRAASSGALLIETRRGPAPRARARSRRVSGFDWSAETEPYRWTRVLGSSFLGNALGLGVALTMANRCFSVEDTGILGLRTHCNGATTLGIGFLSLGLPGLAGSLAAHRAGATGRSRGRVLPAAVFGTMASAAGYLLLIEGESSNSGAAVGAGALILGVATPILLTFSDRLFRALR